MRLWSLSETHEESVRLLEETNAAVQMHPHGGVRLDFSGIDAVLEAINVAALEWGLQCLWYETRDISPPWGLRQAMEIQEEAERKKRSQILESEGGLQCGCSGMGSAMPSV